MSAFTHALSAALIHFAWQGSIVGLLLWAALAAFRNRSANARYVASCAALIALAALPIITTVVLSIDALPMAGARATATSASVQSVIHLSGTVAPLSIGSSSASTSLAWIQVWTLPMWSFGVFLFSVRLIGGYAHAIALGRRGEPADE